MSSNYLPPIMGDYNPQRREGSPADVIERAGWWRRLLSYLIDWVPIGIICAQIPYVGDPVYFLLMFTNLCLMQGITGQSLGKVCTKTKLYRVVRNPDKAGADLYLKPGIPRATLRAALGFVDFFSVIGVFWPILSSRNQLFSDILTSCEVIRTEPVNREYWALQYEQAKRRGEIR